jgi:hypothetical protein
METQEIPQPYNVAAPAFARINELEAKVAELQAIIEDRDRITTKLTNDLASLKDSIRHDSAVISDHAIDTADRHGYCEVYDEFISNVNSQLRVIVLRQREREYEVPVRINATYTMYTKATVTATSMDEARDMVLSDPDSFVDADSIVRDAVGGCYEDDSDYDIEVVD